VERPFRFKPLDVASGDTSGPDDAAGSGAAQLPARLPTASSDNNRSFANVPALTIL
jgi:hypothetical protein